MTPEECSEAVKLFHGTVKAYKKGEFLHRPHEGLPRFGLVLSGAVQACCDDLDGNRTIMAEVTAGITFGESLCFLKISDSPVYIFASEDASVLWLSLSDLYTGGTEPQGLELQKRFTALLAHRTLSMNSRIQILSKLTIREKLLFYFSQLSDGGGTVRTPLNREDMAAYIGTNRSALSRELSKMKQEGILDYRKNLFFLKK